MNRMVGQIHVWRPVELNGVEVKRGVRVRHPHPNHWHDAWHLVLIEEGAGVLSHRNIARPTVRGSLIVVPPGEVHANHATGEEGCSFRTINLRLEAEETWQEHRLLLEDVPVVVTRDRPLVRRFRRLHEALSGAATRMAVEWHALEFLERLTTRFIAGGLHRRKTGAEPAAVRAVRDYLDAHLDRNVSLAELSSFTRISPYHLLRVFRRTTGLPPHAYQNGLRVLRSGLLLRQGRRPAEVALMVGFADQAHLTRHFKRVVGLPPHLYQKQSKNIQDPLQRPG